MGARRRRFPSSNEPPTSQSLPRPRKHSPSPWAVQPSRLFPRSAGRPRGPPSPRPPLPPRHDLVHDFPLGRVPCRSIERQAAKGVASGPRTFPDRPRRATRRGGAIKTHPARRQPPRGLDKLVVANGLFGVTPERPRPHPSRSQTSSVLQSTRSSSCLALREIDGAVVRQINATVERLEQRDHLVSHLATHAGHGCEPLETRYATRSCVRAPRLENSSVPTRFCSRVLARDPPPATSNHATAPTRS